MHLSRCPDCYELIEEGYALTSGAVVLLNTKACGMANTIKTVDPVAVFSIGTAALAYVSDLPSGLLMSTVIWPILAVVAIVIWFLRFGWFRLGDEDFAAALHSMRVRLVYWLALLGGLSVFIYVALKNPVNWLN